MIVTELKCFFFYKLTKKNSFFTLNFGNNYDLQTYFHFIQDNQ